MRQEHQDSPPTLSVPLSLFLRLVESWRPVEEGESIWIMTFPQARWDKLKPDIWWEETEETFQAAPRAASMLPHFQVTAHRPGYIVQLFRFCFLFFSKSCMPGLHLTVFHQQIMGITAGSQPLYYISRCLYDKKGGLNFFKSHCQKDNAQKFHSKKVHPFC